MTESYGHGGWQRRDFLRATGGAMLLAGGGSWQARAAAAPPYRVGVGHQSDPYGATLRAIESTTDWSPALIQGKRVIVKPNLVTGVSADTGTVTDPEVTRAVVDLALRDGAAEVLIAEAGPNGSQPYFAACGYAGFATYDPGGRVRLVDLATEPVVLVDVPRGLAYRKMFLPALIFAPDTVLVSVAKLKVHSHAQATLSMKNLFGLPPQTRYLSPGRVSGRFAMHDRSVSESSVDINLARPIDFAVVDGIIGMERVGPYNGDAVRMDLVVAGRNALAVDLVCLAAMDMPANRVQHLQYAAGLGLGPTRADQIEARGDALPRRTFVTTPLSPLVSYPQSTPASFAPQRGQSTTVYYNMAQAGYARVEIVLTSEINPNVNVVRVLRDWTARAAGVDAIVWDGRDGEGAVVAPNRYGIRVTTLGYGSTFLNSTIGWLGVVA